MRRILFVAVLTLAMAVPAMLQFDTAVADQIVICRDVCTCEARTTPRLTRVGATCSRAQDNAAAAAAAAAQCNAGETPCGPTSVFVSHDCFPHPVSGQIAAEAFADYECESCREVCTIRCRPDIPDRP